MEPKQFREIAAAKGGLFLKQEYAGPLKYGYAAGGSDAITGDEAYVLAEAAPDMAAAILAALEIHFTWLDDCASRANDPGVVVSHPANLALRASLPMFLRP